MGDPFSGVRIFVMAVQEGSFSKAAMRLGLSKSAIGKSLQRLEARLGAELLQRSSKGITLTPDGERYYARCRIAFDELEQGEQEVRLNENEPVGTVRIDMPSSYGRNVVLPILLEQMARYPGLKLVMSFNDRIVDPIESRSNLSIRFGPIRDTHEIMARRLSMQKLLFCASPGYFAAWGIPDTLAALSRHRCLVGFSDQAPPRWAVRLEDGEPGYIMPPATHQIGDGDAIVRAARAGCGICQLPEFMVSEPIRDGLLTSVLSQHIISTPVTLLWPATCRLPHRVRHLIDVLKERLV
ncbi:MULTISPECIES: LysR family transcriptional regulator [Asaia]|uniref:LysR family transcriptional regulator n=1 Tax=Asaia TaxID=91914 RepID=UPI002FC399C4